MTSIENGQHIIIEGCYIPPEHIGDFEPEYLKQIIALYIGFSKNYIDNHFDTGIVGHLNEIEQKCFDDYIDRNNFLRLHSHLKESCKLNNAKFFEINDDYERETKSVYKWIDKQVKAL